MKLELIDQLGLTSAEAQPVGNTAGESHAVTPKQDGDVPIDGRWEDAIGDSLRQVPSFIDRSGFASGSLTSASLLKLSFANGSANGGQAQRSANGSAASYAVS